MIDILNKIVAHKKETLSASQKKLTVEDIIDDLKQKPLYGRKCYSAKSFIKNNQAGIIAEFKRKSPSKQNINLKAKATDIIPAYAKNGAAAISILTDEHFFGGNNKFIEANRHLSTPFLRKDFIIDEIMVYEAKAIGADFILLIAAILSEEEIIKFTDLAHDLGMEVLLEFHAGEEFEKLYPKVDLVGINNRNLKTFEVDLNHSIKMRNALGHNHICVAESGIGSVEDYRKLKNEGFDAFLMGEFFMKHKEPGKALKNFIQSI